MTDLGRGHHGSRRHRVAICAVLVPIALGLTACSAVAKAVNAVKGVHNLVHEVDAINALSGKIKSADGKPYEVTYVTTGSAPATIDYAAEPPGDFAFNTKTANGDLEVIAGPAGQFECNRASAAGEWSCLKLDSSSTTTGNAAYLLYSGSFWVDFLKVYSVAAALHGVSITSSTMTVNGFNLQCTDVVSGTKPNQSSSKWCVTTQGILGYVSVSSKGADFEIKSYTASPSASLFQVPAGATITTIPTTTTS